MNSNGQVVWHENSENGDFEIFYYDGNAVQRITNNDYEDRLPVISDNGIIAWRGGPSDELIDIFIYNGSEILNLSNNSYFDEEPLINKQGDIVWRGFDGQYYQVYYAQRKIIPEPSTFFLLGTSLLGLAFKKRA
ncbi:MAG: hypothetical protein A3G33_11670 [Omnitrophica bacterium RIFCSPLOWO2_12_FULL_44_17]|uniref:Ice-binding protein C-terminal domain-containing protein n=1 Tax=Candidatus Danuiimicrobium aquiferis TaxID=1801832 RepID=A0A1G1KRT8_9BACT|nr:MAG: hypothetical protein A3B72_09510 [Omnitrophica bacterium RIFCSPHIGHO2_02_FULL_45_28]OGW95646.1 MAG: hypothetical protein A3G33_11670 [Omnitrophica bacterium RIFCSPLOWO2_12_FULL_44_17]